MGKRFNEMMINFSSRPLKDGNKYSLIVLFLTIWMGIISYSICPSAQEPWGKVASSIDKIEILSSSGKVKLRL